MQYLVRSINGDAGGSALAVRKGGNDEQLLAIFADASCRDFVLLGDHHCLALSYKGEVALVDLATLQVEKRLKQSRRYDRLAVSVDHSRAIAYHCNPGLVQVIDLKSFHITARYNLIKLRDDGQFDLLNKDNEALKAEGIPWDSIPTSDGSLKQETRDDSPFLRYASDTPSGLRRMLFPRAARAVFRADGKVVLPFGFFKYTGPSWVSDPKPKNPSIHRMIEVSDGLAVLDLDAQTARFDVLRTHLQGMAYSNLPVRSFSPDGMTAVVPALEPVKLSPKAPETSGLFQKVFGRKNAGDYAMALEIWDIGDQPTLQRTIPYRVITGENLLRTDTQRFNKAELAQGEREIDLIFKGIDAAYLDRLDDWRSSSARKAEDQHFEPLEQAPAYNNPAYNRVAQPILFAATVKRLMSLDPQPFSSFPWEKCEPRQCELFAGVLGSWSKHCEHGTDTLLWLTNDKFLTLSRGGRGRIISTGGDLGSVYQLSHPDGSEWKYWSGYDTTVDIQRGASADFELRVHGDHWEIDWPTSNLSPMESAESVQQVKALRVNKKDLKENERLRKKVDRMTAKIRRGYVKVSGRDTNDIVSGLEELSREVRAHLPEIVVDHRWAPALYYRGKPIIEDEFCDILVADPSEAGIRALDNLLTAFLDATEGDHENIWHPDDLKPTMGPVTVALIKMTNPLPASITRFYARRDMDHDMWTYQAFEEMGLSDKRLLSADLVTLQIRLAIQDICTGNMDPNIFALYRLPLVRDVLHRNPQLVPDICKVIVDQTEAQAPHFTWASSEGVAGVLAAISDELNKGQAAEKAMAVALMDEVEARRAPERAGQ
ncbi:hypothetical protein [Erythrobacter longus]|uniref:hypothetical protein n=1 Tax=Erythrobacter longus TaxID=1044 RepID=UPI000AA60E49|nr:hypothetical protein [Erythrobacter longus]